MIRDEGSGERRAPAASGVEAGLHENDRDRDGDGVLLYHEPQVSRLCGVHCLNTLLQGPYFTEVDLAAMAEELDRREREVMMESGTDSQEYLRFIAEGSGNVAADGNFSIQVLDKALAVWGVRCLPLDMAEASNARRDPQTEKAFICNLHSHWFTIRKVEGEWYNFNSLFPAPEHFSHFYLNAYLSSLQQSGWTIFVVRGELPKEMGVHGGSHDLSGSYGRWLGPKEAARITKESKKARDDARRVPGNDAQLAAAIKASMEEEGCEEESERMEEDDSMDADLRAAIAASLADGLPSTSGAAAASGAPPAQILRDPAEIARALAETYQAMVNPRATGIAAASSLLPSSSEAHATSSSSSFSSPSPSTSRRSGEEACSAEVVVAVGSAKGLGDGGVDSEEKRRLTVFPPATPPPVVPEPSADTEGCLQLALRLPSGARVCRRFRAEGTLKDLVDFVGSQGWDMSKYKLAPGFPGGKDLDDESLSLASMGLMDKSLIVVKPR